MSLVSLLVLTRLSPVSCKTFAYLATLQPERLNSKHDILQQNEDQIYFFGRIPFDNE